MNCKKMALRALSSLNEIHFKEFLNSFDTVLTDCDGVLWLGNEIIKGSLDVINYFKENGKKVFFVTNNSTKTRAEFVEKCKLLGYNTKENEIVCTAHLTASYLKSINFTKKVYVLGPSAIGKELDNVGISHIGVGPDIVESDILRLARDVKLDPEVGAVVVGFDQYFSLPKMLKAATYLKRNGTLFIVTNTDERFPLNSNIVLPDAGSMVASIITCVDRKAFSIGKPDSYIREYLIQEHNIDPSRTIMFGDRCRSDILLGKKCGFQTLLVLSGVTSLEQVKEWKSSNDKELKALVPDYYTGKLGDLLPHLKIS